MNKKNLVNILNKEIIILSELINGFDDNGSIHPMEVDLALSKVKDIYNELILLKEDAPEKDLKSEIPDPFAQKGSAILDKEQPVIEKEAPKVVEESKIIEEPDPVVKEVESVPEKMSEVDVEEEATLELAEDESIENTDVPEVMVEKPVEIEQEEIQKEESVEPEEVSEPVQEKVEEPLEEPMKEPEPEPVKKEEKVVKNEIIADKFSNNAPSVNDMMAGIKKNKDLASYLKAGPVKDLKKAIKLNDRIWYINELFNKNAATYEKTVDVLNQFENLDQALEYIFTNFAWDQNRKSTISFLELVFRRFASK